MTITPIKKTMVFYGFQTENYKWFIHHFSNRFLYQNENFIFFYFNQLYLIRALSNFI